ncbi:hypothetical protein BDN71DRAFT_1478799 [Pleurotus eryngii]|uniref:Fungal-type protein kinase domain-containing protein n=1 Tax=Pleurotus eryngii TaxID=5323 RepID=A0A9P6D8X9_PLEER|nr:hypothetical protein BDN71DRAFT_1478799 [Pleurotus eryngii]
MCREMSGRWVGPCKVADFFKLTMPIELKKGRKEKLPKIDKKFFAGKKPANEKAMTKTIIEFFGTDNFTEIQIVDTSAHSDPNSKRGAKLRPDLSFRDKRDVIDPNSPTQLGDALGGGEVKDTLVEVFSDVGPLFELETFTAQQARGQLATYAVEFCARQHRTHLFFLYIYYPCARLIRFDRAGALVSERFDFTHDCTPLIRFFSRFSKMTPAQRGYDPTVQVADEPETKLARERLKEWAPDPKYERAVFKMEVYDDQKQGGDNDSKKPKPRKFLVWGSLADPESPLGRATRGYPALEVTDGLDEAKEAPPMFLKEQWRSIALRPEIDTLRELKDGGVKYVPTLECGGDLPDQVTQTAVYATKIGKRGDKDIDTRIHVRFVVLQVGRPIERFSSSKEMFQAVYDAFQGHKQAYEKCKLLHRDVSGGNILLVTNGGLLNDWDMAVKVNEDEQGPRAHERTGTWAFMSIDLLFGERRPHRISDDLESFFWVVLYYGLLYLPHNKVDNLYEIITAVFEQYSYYAEAKGGAGKYTMVMKGGYIGRKALPRLEFIGNKPLTRFVKAMLKFLRNCQQREDASSSDDEDALVSGAVNKSESCLGPQKSMPPPPSQEQMRNDVETLFKLALDQPWPTDDKAKLHIIKNPKGEQAPTGGTGAGGSKKRKSTIQTVPEEDTEGRQPKKAKSSNRQQTSTKAPKRSRTKKSTSMRRRGGARAH